MEIVICRSSRARGVLSAVVLSCLVACGGRGGGDGDGERAAEPVEHRPDPVTPRTDGAAVEYTLRFPEPHTHYVEVEAVYPAAGDELQLWMAVWTPGSYLVREYARHVEELRASTVDGDPLEVEKIEKNRWRVVTAGADRAVVRYRLYCRELSVRTNFVSAEHAILNGAPTFITGAGMLEHPHDVRIERPEGWPRVVTGLPEHPDGEADRYLAADYDMLVDSPVLVGDPELYEFDVEGVPHVLADMPEDDRWDGERAAADLEILVAEQLRFWGVAPYDRYWFLNVLLGPRGGLEHERSTLMMADPWSMRRREDYLDWLGLASHEFFHTWNVKRLRPKALGPFDYENEVYTRSLWGAEGITSYYDDLLLRRADLMDRDEYLGLLSDQIESVQKKPGRKVQSLAEASFDAWIKYYRADENFRNTGVSYYRKGAVVAWLLDTEIRRATAGRKDLGDVMRLAYQRHSGDTGYTPEQFRAVVDEVAGRDLSGFFERHVDGTAELDYQPALEYYGLRFPETEDEDTGGQDDEDDEEPAYLGVRTSGAEVRRVKRRTPAHEAGINVGDEILAIDDYRVQPGELNARLERYRPGDEVSVLVARHGVLRRIPVTLGSEPDQRWRLERVDDPTRAQTAHLRAWLGT